MTGLLSGVIINISEGYFYSDCISIKEASLLLQNRANLFNICLESSDGDYDTAVVTLENIFIESKTFINSTKVWDREELNNILNDVITNNIGSFLCLLAGKNTGKSFVLSGLNNSNVIVVNLREDPNILTGLISELRKRSLLSTGTTRKLFLKVFSNVTKTFLKVSDDNFSLDKYIDIILSNKEEPTLFQTIIVELIKNFPCITLIIDEANIALSVDNSTPQADVKSTKNALALFTLLTKEKKLLNVILVSSEHSFPFRLQNPKLDFNLENFTGYIFAGEVSPYQMYNLLTIEWKIASNLAIALINLFGGHIWDTYQAIIRLKNKREKFWIFDSTLYSNVQSCLQYDDFEGMKKVLEMLAIKGFVPIKNRNDPIAQVISEFGVGGVVSNTADIIGLNSNVWDESSVNYGIVPSKQSMRLVIAKVLSDIKVDNNNDSICQIN